jgi:hypothetical protein
VPADGNGSSAGPITTSVTANHVSASLPEQQAAPNIPETISTGNDDTEDQPKAQGGSEMEYRTLTVSPAPSALVGGPSTNLVPDTNAWFKSWFTHFREISADATWQTLVSEWVHFETLTTTEGVSDVAPCFLLSPYIYMFRQRLPTASRPEEVSWWIKRKKSINLPPPIENAAEFGATWKQWWTAMQPEWRKGEPLVTTVPADADWTPLIHGGSNGLSLVVVALSWWVSATDVHSVDISDAIHDVKWVLSELVRRLSSVETPGGSKRRSEASPDRTKSKK